MGEQCVPARFRRRGHRGNALCANERDRERLRQFRVRHLERARGSSPRPLPPVPERESPHERHGHEPHRYECASRNERVLLGAGVPHEHHGRLAVLPLRGGELRYRGGRINEWTGLRQRHVRIRRDKRFLPG